MPFCSCRKKVWIHRIWHPHAAIWRDQDRASSAAFWCSHPTVWNSKKTPKKNHNILQNFYMFMYLLFSWMFWWTTPVGCSVPRSRTLTSMSTENCSKWTCSVWSIWRGLSCRTFWPRRAATSPSHRPLPVNSALPRRPVTTQRSTPCTYITRLIFRSFQSESLFVDSKNRDISKQLAPN